MIRRKWERIIKKQKKEKQELKKSLREILSLKEKEEREKRAAYFVLLLGEERKDIREELKDPSISERKRKELAEKLKTINSVIKKVYGEFDRSELKKKKEELRI